MRCPACDEGLPEAARFCPRCGAACAAAPEPPADPVRDLLKAALGRQYEVGRLLGRGGMGAVYLATETALEREVAVKVLPPEHGATRESRERFRREARTAAKLSHPHIVPLHTFGDVDGTLYFVMGYVPGESLAVRLRREGRLPVEEARRILRELADALAYAHAQGIVHRDIKPDNVLLEAGSGRALLTDFGVAKAQGAGQTMTAVGSLLGTPQYMSPEQAQGRADLDARSDLYSFGVMAYAMLAGRLPFEGATVADVLVQHITKEPPPLDVVAPDVPPEMVAAIGRCLAKDPAKRFVDAASLKAALAATGDEEEVPIELEGVANIARVGFAGLLALYYQGAWVLGGGELPEAYLVPVLSVSLIVICLLILGYKYSESRRLGLPSRRILYEMFKQPLAWSGWYPRALRRRGDVWDRLPLDLRRARALGGFTALLGVLALAPFFLLSWGANAYVIRTGQRPFADGWTEPRIVILLVAVLMAVQIWMMVRWVRRARARGLGRQRVHGTLETATSRTAFWSHPEVAALLVAPGAADAEAHTTAQDLSRAVERACAGLASSPSRQTGEAAAAAARRLAAAIQALDSQCAALAAGVDAAETVRLADKLATLGPARASEPVERGQMRELLQKQLDVLRGVEARVAAVQARRSRLIDLLRRLFASARDLTATPEASREGRHAPVRAIVAEIEAELATASAPAPVAALTNLPTLER
ncbi:MAG: serine/threonine protein kinase [Vicinamibacteria bacterium]|nr:serine/threonine protein kinase [Vicinamibacteria bacterium]